MLVCDLLDDFAVDGFGAPLEDGESELVDRWRAWLATRHVAHNACGEPGGTNHSGANGA